MALLMRGGWVDSVPPSGSVGRGFKYKRWNVSDANSHELFTNNYTGQLSQPPLGIDKFATAEANWDLSPSHIAQFFLL